MERALVETMEIPRRCACAISVSLDRVSIPMEEPREEGQRKSEKESEKESERVPKEPEKGARRESEEERKMRSVQRVFRMAYAATVTLHDATGRPFTPCDMAGCRRGHRWPVHSA